MNALSTSIPRRRLASWRWLRQFRQPVTLCFLLVLLPTLALAQSGTPFDTGFTALQTLFTGTIAKVASLIAIVIGGYRASRRWICSSATSHARRHLQCHRT